MYSGIKKADVTAPNGAVFTFTYESFTDTYICYLGGEKAERAAALFDVVDLYDAISRSITTVRKYGGWVEHTVTPAWRLPIVGSEVTFKIT